MNILRHNVPMVVQNMRSHMDEGSFDLHGHWINDHVTTGYRLLVELANNVHVGSVKLNNIRDCKLRLCGRKKETAIGWKTKS